MFRNIYLYYTLNNITCIYFMKDFSKHWLIILIYIFYTYIAKDKLFRILYLHSLQTYFY